jgi:amino acid permease
MVSSYYDDLVPDFNSSRRKSHLIPAIFNLSATIIGGGVLTLPLAFQKCGIFLSIILMIVSGIITECALLLLCLSARISKAQTYGEVGKAAFGADGEYFISLILFVYLMFVLVAFMIFVQDIWASILEIILHKQEGDLNESLVLFVVLILMSPFFVQKSLYNLRYNCYVGFFSIPILLVALSHHDWAVSTPRPLKFWSSSVEDILFAFPVINLSFLCVFNVLPIQASLIHPTRERMKLVIDFALGGAFMLMVPFGISGYLYAGEKVSGNILNSITSDGDWLFFLGRLGCGITLTLAMPLMVLPCRENLLKLIDVVVNGPHAVETDEELPLIINNVKKKVSDNNEDNVSSNNKGKRLDGNIWFRYLVTLGMINTSYLISIRIPGVAVVWSLAGSSMAFFIAFILPGACYLQIQHRYPHQESRVWLWFSYGLVAVFPLVSIVCTSQSIFRLLS